MNIKRTSIEPLESRIAPAVIIGAGAQIATYTDVDGDLVTIAVSKGAMNTGDFTTFPSGLGEQLARIDFHNTGPLDGANLRITATPQGANGDGFVNVGRIDATGIDLGRVVVHGDLADIDAGNPNLATPAVIKLRAQSLGALGAATIGAPDVLKSELVGPLGTLAVKGDVAAMVDVSGSDWGTIGAVKIGGSLAGGDTVQSGGLRSSGDMGLIKIGHDLIGGTAGASGFIISKGDIAGVTVGGSLLGGPDTNTGKITAKWDIGFIKIGGDLQGGAGLISGEVFCGEHLGAVKIGGSLIGGGGGASGKISAGSIGTVKIAHDLLGGSIDGDKNGGLSGAIETTLDGIGSIKIGGSIIAGTDKSTGDMEKCASILSMREIGSIDVGGDIIGNRSSGGLSPVTITALASATYEVGDDLAIGRITVGGNVSLARILAGYTPESIAWDADAQIGTVKVGGDWTASDLVAGVQDDATAVLNAYFGDANDTKVDGGFTKDAAGEVSAVAKIVIAGQVRGTAVSANDHYGFVAQQIATLKVGAQQMALAPGTSNDVLALAGDVTVREVAI